MLGHAALAMWWDMAPDVRDEFEHWHTHEHFSERLALPGFLRASRWADADGGEGFFVLYELDRVESLASPAYLARLNAPTDWSRRRKPHDRRGVPSPCRVAFAPGARTGARAVTRRRSPRPAMAQALQDKLHATAVEVATRQGLAGMAMLKAEPQDLDPTTEQRIRGLADRTADWVLVVTGYDAAALARIVQDELSGEALSSAGAAPGSQARVHRLRMSMARPECAQT